MIFIVVSTIIWASVRVFCRVEYVLLSAIVGSKKIKKNFLGTIQRTYLRTRTSARLMAYALCHWGPIFPLSLKYANDVLTLSNSHALTQGLPRGRMPRLYGGKFGGDRRRPSSQDSLSKGMRDRTDGRTDGWMDGRAQKGRADGRMFGHNERGTDWKKLSLEDIVPMEIAA